MYYLKYLLSKALNFVVFKKELRNSCDRLLISCLKLLLLIFTILLSEERIKIVLKNPLIKCTFILN